jgi:hypothetical protein
VEGGMIIRYEIKPEYLKEVVKMLTLFIILAVAAMVITILSTFTPPKAPLWVAVLLLCMIELVRALPVGR